MAMKEETNVVRRDIYQCVDCWTKFTQKYNLNRHRREKHHSKISNMGSATPQTILCGHCDKTFSTNRGWVKHMRNIHKVKYSLASQQIENSLIICKTCGEKFAQLRDLREHVEERHDVRASSDMMSLDFATLQEFQAWKQSMEKETKTLYVAHTGANHKEDGYSQTFHCFRSGLYRRVSEEKRQRAPQAQGSWKINTYCTSAIKISVNSSGETSVQFFKHHFGHCLESDEKMLDSLDIKRQKLKQYLDQLTGKVGDCQSLEAMESVETLFMEAQAILDVAACKQTNDQVPTEDSSHSTPCQPINKNATKQVCTKKRQKRSTTKDYSRPLKTGQKVYSNILLKNNDEEMPLTILQKQNIEYQYSIRP